jgi:hypothetical protein
MEEQHLGLAYRSLLKWGWLIADDNARRPVSVAEGHELDVDELYQRWFTWSEKQRDIEDSAWSHMRSFSSSSLPPPY